MSNQHQQYPQQGFAAPAQQNEWAEVGPRKGYGGDGNAEKASRWSFDQYPVFEGFLLRKILDFKGKFGQSSFYICKSAHDQTDYIVGGTKVLDDRISNVAEGSYIQIHYLGVPAGKSWKDWKVLVNTNIQPMVMIGGTPAEQYKQQQAPAFAPSVAPPAPSAPMPQQNQYQQYPQYPAQGSVPHQTTGQVPQPPTQANPFQPAQTVPQQHQPQPQVAQFTPPAGAQTPPPASAQFTPPTQMPGFTGEAPF